MAVFVAGATGYMGSKLIPVLTGRGHSVKALARKGSETKAPAGCEIISGDALNSETYSRQVTSEDTFVHMIGVAHPSPSKAALFRKIDLPALYASVEAAKSAGVKHFVYVSVAHPARLMREYVQTRIEAEQHIEAQGLNATFLRPWYVLGPGHRWAYALIPLYSLFKTLPATSETARRLDLVTLEQMTAALVHAIETPAVGIRVIDAQHIKKSRL